MTMLYCKLGGLPVRPIETWHCISKLDYLPIREYHCDRGTCYLAPKEVVDIKSKVDGFSCNRIWRPFGAR